jgi:diacylglycerol kinase
METMNTAIEAAVDLASPNIHPLAKKAKDCAAGAVLLSVFGTVCIGVIVFIPKLVAALSVTK